MGINFRLKSNLGAGACRELMAHAMIRLFLAELKFKLNQEKHLREMAEQKLKDCETERGERLTNLKVFLRFL